MNNHDHCCDHAPALYTEDGVEPAVCSVKTGTVMGGKGTAGQCRAKLEETIQAVIAEAESEGWLIGHIKAYMQTENGELWLSSAGGVINRHSTFESAETLTGEGWIGLTAIVFGPDEEALYSLVHGLL